MTQKNHDQFEKIKISFNKNSNLDIGERILFFFEDIKKDLSSVVDPLKPKKKWTESDYKEISYLCVIMFGKFEKILKDAIVDYIDFNYKSIDGKTKEYIISKYTNETIKYPTNERTFFKDNFSPIGFVSFFELKNKQKLINYKIVSEIYKKMRCALVHTGEILDFDLDGLWVTFLSLTNLLINIDYWLFGDENKINKKNNYEIIVNKDHFPGITSLWEG